MTPSFKIVEHAIPGQHIREYPGGTKRRQEEVLQLAVKQYIPLAEDDAIRDDAVTILGVHGNGFPKETYEPLWEDLYTELRSHGVQVRGIWIADSSAQGASGVLNEDVQGDSANWFDHSRDMLLMVNHFRAQMPRPIIGVAHSMGCAQLIRLSIMHPRLLSAVLLYEPAIGTPNKGPNPALMSTLRRDLWPSRDAAEVSLRRAFRTWDPRAVEAYLQYGLRAIPTALYSPSSSPSQDATATISNHSIPASAVTLTTSKHQEAWAFAQLTLDPVDSVRDRLLRPDWDPERELPFRTVRPESSAVMADLPHLRPAVLWVFGGRSPMSALEAQDEKMRVTGVGVGGSGGAAPESKVSAIENEAQKTNKGKVQKVVIKDAGHLLVFEQVKHAAGVGAEWLAAAMAVWSEEEHMLAAHKSVKSVDGMLRMSDRWVANTKMKLATPRPTRSEKL